MRCNQAQTISDERFSIGRSSEIPRISDRILIENRSSEIFDKKLPISDSGRHGFFLPIGNIPIGKNDSVRNGLLGHLLWPSYLGYIVFGSGNLGTSNPIRLFYGVVFGQIR